MEKARIFLVEDEKGIREIIKSQIQKAQHRIVLTASNYLEAEEAISRGKLLELRVNVAVVDGNIPYDGNSIGTFLGPNVAKLIRDTGLPIKIIAHTSLSEATATYGDVYAFKPARQLVSTINSL